AGPGRGRAAARAGRLRLVAGRPALVRAGDRPPGSGDGTGGPAGPPRPAPPIPRTGGEAPPRAGARRPHGPGRTDAGRTDAERTDAGRARPWRLARAGVRAGGRARVLAADDGRENAGPLARDA